MGALVTLDLPDESPVLSLPWIITFGPLSDEEEWEPVVCGPYERDHALALAESVVADEDLMAVVEPVLPHTTVDEIRSEIIAAKAAAEEDEDEEVDVDFEEEYDETTEYQEADAAEADDETDDDEDDLGFEADEEVEPSPPPSPEEIRAGFARIAAKLTGS